VGYGAGTRDLPGTPNVLRVLLGEADEAALTQQVVVIEADIDDMSPQLFAPVMDCAARAGRARRVPLGGADEEEPAGDAPHRPRPTGSARAPVHHDLP
jgi:hypothetical protein